MHIVGPQCTQQPAVLQSLLEKTEQLERDMKTLTLQPYDRSILPINESAYPRKSSKDLSLEYQQRGTRRASKPAPKKKPHDAEHDSLAFYKRLSFWKGFFDVTLQVCLKIGTGAGGNAINKNPRFHATVPDDSPAFALFKTKDAGWYKIRLDQRHRQLFELFQSGKSSPLDKLPNGETILYVSFTLNHPLSHERPRVHGS